MTRYAWPEAPSLPDDSRGRRAFLAARRSDFDPVGASRAARTPAPGSGLHGGLAAPATGRDNLWISLGPETILAGLGNGRPRVAGRVNSFAVSDDGQRVYAGAAVGGVWYSRDAGTTWHSAGGLAPTQVGEVTRPATRNAIGAVALRPGTEATDQVFVGTGEPYHFSAQMVGGRPGRSLGGIGVLVATGPGNPGHATPANPWVREAANLVGEAVNRLALQPGGSGVLAATTVGLFRRPSPLPADTHWERVRFTSSITVESECTDVLWTPANGGRPERVWVWVRGGDHVGLWVQDGGAGDFRKVATTGAQAGRAVLAASSPATQIWVFLDQGRTASPLLFRVTSPASADLPAAASVANVPNVVKIQGDYDIAIAVDPANPDRVYLAGSWLEARAPDGTALVDASVGNYDGALVWGDVAVHGATLSYGPPGPPIPPPNVVGIGMHADVHDIRFSAPGSRLWAGCDGGMFRSDRPTSQVGFVACNTGLATAQSNFTVSHPSCEGFLVAGLQDNGVIKRMSSGVWDSVALADGGGVILDPVKPDRWIYQYVQGNWSASDGSIVQGSPLHRMSPPPPPLVRQQRAKTENDGSAFYSSGAGIAFVRPILPPLVNLDVRQIVIGTRRLWYTDDFGKTWFTLPSATDPLAGAGAANLATDNIGDAILVCRWQGPHVVWVLADDHLLRYSRTPGTEGSGIPGTWVTPPEEVLKRGTTGKKNRKNPTGPLRQAEMWTDLAVNEETPIRGTRGAVYLGTIGSKDNAAIDTLWWYDGTSTWHATGLRAQVPAPVTAIACDPAHPEEVWVGTTVGVWRGIRTLAAGQPPRWAWETRVNGLPEAAVEDLTIFSHGGLRLLRAAIASRGLWELRLDVADVQDLTYLRVHDDDLRYRTTASMVAADNRTIRSWHGSPDIRPRVPGAAVATPADLPWSRQRFNPDGLRRFRAALRSSTGDSRVRVSNAWDPYFNEVLRSLPGAPLVPPLPAPLPAPAAATNIGISAAFWAAHMTGVHATAEPWGTAAPAEVDLLESRNDLGAVTLSEGVLKEASSALPPRSCLVDVVVHHRGLGTRPGGQVRVTLLRWVDPRPAATRSTWNDSSKWAPGNVPWTTAVNTLLNTAAAPASIDLTGGWRFAEASAANAMRTLAVDETLTNTHSGVVTFTVDLTGIPNNRVVLLVAVIRAGNADAADNLALAAAPLETLVLNSPQVAARSVRIQT